MLRRTAPASFLSVSVGSHLNYTALLGTSNHLHFFSAPACSADELQARHFLVGLDHSFYVQLQRSWQSWGRKW